MSGQGHGEQDGPRLCKDVSPQVRVNIRQSSLSSKLHDLRYLQRKLKQISALSCTNSWIIDFFHKMCLPHEIFTGFWIIVTDCGNIIDHLQVSICILKLVSTYYIFNFNLLCSVHLLEVSHVFQAVSKRSWQMSLTFMSICISCFNQLCRLQTSGKQQSMVCLSVSCWKHPDFCNFLSRTGYFYFL